MHVPCWWLATEIPKMERNFQQTVSCEHDMAPEVSNIDVEECVSSGMLCHDTSYHDFAETEKKGFQSALLAWYDRDKRTNMPWRKPTRTDLDREVRSILRLYGEACG